MDLAVLPVVPTSEVASHDGDARTQSRSRSREAPFMQPTITGESWPSSASSRDSPVGSSPTPSPQKRGTNTALNLNVPSDDDISNAGSNSGEIVNGRLSTSSKTSASPSPVPSVSGDPPPSSPSRTSWSRRTFGSVATSGSRKDSARRTSVKSTFSRFSDYSRASSMTAVDFSLSIHDLINNATANALDRGSRNFGDNGVMAGPSTVDWHRKQSQERLEECYHVVRQLFNAFADVSEDMVNSGSGGRISHCPTRTRHTRTAKILELRQFTALSLFFTVYALFCVDIAGLLGYSSSHNEALASINTAVLGFFLVESLLQYFALPGYACSGRFWVDLLAALSMSGDTLLGYKVFSSGQASAGRGTRVLRMLRMGGRSSRALRMLKNLRLLQGLKVLPKLLKIGVSDRHTLSVLLFNERLHRLFQYLDGGDKRYLSEIEKQYFIMSLRIAFPKPLRTMTSMDNFVGYNLWKSIKRSFKALGERIEQFWMSFSSKLHLRRRDHERGKQKRDSQIPLACTTFPQLLKEFILRPEAKMAFEACSKDLERVEHSAELFNETTSKVMIKVSCLVLAVLCVMPFLEVPIDDLGDWQTMSQLHAISLANHSQQVCSLVQQLCTDSRDALLYAEFSSSINWEQNCDLSVCTSIYHLASLGAGTLMSKAGVAMERRGIEPQELLLYCLPDTSCENEAAIRSIVLFDTHVRSRGTSGQQMLYTSLAILLMVSFVHFFGGDLRRLKKSVLLPMWDLLDDMVAMKIFEFARARDLTQMAENLSADPFEKPVNSRHISDRFAGALESCMHKCRVCRGSKEVEPEEITMLKNAFKSMRQAMRSWAKYVPSMLVKRLFCAGLEASLGVSKQDVTVVFFDIVDFDEICRAKVPTEALKLLCSVQEVIEKVLDDTKGTLLEMIGDEMLAIYNAPLTVHGHAGVALEAAVTAFEEVEKKWPDISLRCGVHRAEVLVGNIGSNRRMKYGVLGDGVNATARLKSLNSQFNTKILTSAQTLFCAPDVLDTEPGSGNVVCRPAGHFVLKGHKKFTDIWEVVAFREEMSVKRSDAYDLHREAFKLYLNRDFQTARRHFVEVNMSLQGQEVFIDDCLSRRMIDSCDEFIVNPPAEDWDGSEMLKKK